MRVVLAPGLRRSLVPCVVFAIFLITFFGALNYSYPILGHDFFYFFPRLLVGKWHVLAQGISPLRWAPQFCGGFPVYGNPHDLFYSLPQMFSLFLGLWTSVQLSILAALIVGYVGWQRFGRDVLRLSSEWAHVLALVILSNGYYVMHMAAGHVDYHTLPLIGWIFWFIFERGRPDVRKAGLFALLIAVILYAAGYFVLPLAALAILLFLPYELLRDAPQTRLRLTEISRRAALYLPLTLALCGSKLVAVWSLMRFLPRTIPFDVFPAGVSGFLFILKSFFAVPQGRDLFVQVNKWGIHEYSMFLSPLVLIGVFIGLRNFYLRSTPSTRTANILQAACGILLLVFFSELARGSGLLVDWLKDIPVFSSFRVTVRFLYVPALLLCMFGVAGLSAAFRHERFRKLIIPVAGAITILSFVAAYLPLLNEGSLLLTMRYDEVRRLTDASSYLNRSVSTVAEFPQAMPSDIQAVLDSSTSIGCYEPLLDHSTLRKSLTAGKTDRIDGGSYNLLNPACFQYPDENHCAPGDRIAASDRENLIRFTNGLPTTWHLSVLQHMADWVSFLTLIFLLVSCIWLAVLQGTSYVRILDLRLLRDNNRFMDIRSRLTEVFMRLRLMILRKNQGSSDGFRMLLTVVLSIIGLAFVAYICAFKLLDRDFWWHITAGEIMWKTHALIATEPFSYARAGLPYVASHEWLAQIILYLLYYLGGSTAIILFRTAVMAACLGLLLLLDRRNVWLLVPIAILAGNAMRGAFIERPQLFTFLIFSLLLFLTFHILALRAAHPPSGKQRRNFLISFVVLQILWVNLHGGASLLALLFPGVLFLEIAWQWFRSPASHRPALETELRWCVLLGLLLFVGLFCSPTTYENLTYLWKLLSDRTIIYIQEWQPDSLDLYLKNIGPFWILAGGAIAIGRKNIVASSLLVLITGYLSVKALRHEPLFVLSALAVIAHQMKGHPGTNRLRTWLLERRIATVLLSFVLFFGLAEYTHAQYAAFTRPDQLQGYGTFEFGKGAADFLEKNNVQGTMFNTYGIGGYLIHRGRKVFIDGRNVDYGFAYMNQTYLAGTDPVQWQKLEKKYGFTYAVIDYFSNKDKKKNILLYAQFLENNPDWSLVYVDDWTAVFLKNIPENKVLTSRLAFHVLTASNLEFKTVLDHRTPEDLQTIEQELRRASADSPPSMKARILLGKFLIRSGRLDEAQVVTQDAAIAVPNSPETHALFAAIYIVQKNWEQAANELEKTLRLAGNDYPDLDYGLVAQVFLQAGRVKEAKEYARKAGLTITEHQEQVTPTNPDGTSAITNPETKAGTGSEAPMVNPAQDAIDFENKALAFAEAGKNAEARENFLIALKLNPSSAQGWNNLGTLSFFESKLDEAIGEYKRAIQEDPTYADPHYNLALLYARQGKMGDARSEAERAQKLGKDISALKEVLK